MAKTKIKVKGVSGSTLAQEHGCSVDLINKLRKQGLLEKGVHWWVVNPQAVRPTYRYYLAKCLLVLRGDA